MLESPIHEIYAKIKFVNGDINKNTLSHPYYIKNKGWCSLDPTKTLKKYGFKVNKISVGDECLFNNRGSIEYVKIKKYVVKKKIQQTYNLKHVSENNNFFVNGYLVHNVS